MYFELREVYHTRMRRKLATKCVMSGEMSLRKCYGAVLRFRNRNRLYLRFLNIQNDSKKFFLNM